MGKIFLTAAALVLLSGCINRRAAVPETEREYTIAEDVTEVAENDLERTAGAHTAENSLDFTGTYRGILPCADYSGIETVLKLEDNGEYMLTSKYLDKDDKIYTSQGRYSWLGDGTRIILDDGPDAGNRYFIAEGRIFMLDRDGNRVEGPLSEHYILTKE
ncbi:MAG: copper resistance protein NlpE [Alistipes sp.]|nr:copper resistance protein NlpE [Alistipes sp.]